MQLINKNIKRKLTEGSKAEEKEEEEGKKSLWCVVRRNTIMDKYLYTYKLNVSVYILCICIWYIHFPCQFHERIKSIHSTHPSYICSVRYNLYTVVRLRVFGGIMYTMLWANIYICVFARAKLARHINLWLCMRCHLRLNGILYLSCHLGNGY